MHPKHGLSAALIGTSIALVASYNQTANALTAVEVGKIAKQITVRIEFQADGLKKQGSGFIVKKSDNTYYVVTAYHVVAAEAKYSLVTPDGDRYNLDSKKISYKSGTDLAVVQFTSSKTYQLAKIGNSDNSPEGSTVYVAGFPSGTAIFNSSETYRFVPGTISANASQPLREGYSLAYTNPTSGGMSGGPVFNEQGEIIGIHGVAETEARGSGDGVKAVSTGNNLGISVNTFLRLALLDTGVKAPVQVAAAPKADDFYLKAADLADNKKDYRGAIEALNQALEINPKYAKAYYGRGLVHHELKDYPKALEDYKQAITIDPKLAQVYSNLGIIYYELKDYDKAIANYTQALAIDPKLAQAYSNRGLVHKQLKDYPKALADYSQAIALDSKLAQAYFNRGLVYAELKDYSKALADYNQAITIDPKSADTYTGRGLVHFELEDYPKALLDYNQAIALDSKSVNAYNNRGWVHRQLKDYPNAIADFSQAIALDSKLAQAYSNRGVVYYELKDYPKAIADYNQAISLEPKLAKVYSNRGFAYYELQNTDAAISNWRKAAKLNSQLLAPILSLGVALYAKGEEDEGLRLWKEGVELVGIVPDLQQLKGAGWGDVLLQDAAKLLKDPRL
jgi:tetratricopeptide (TPR) repeat protein